MTRRPKKAKTSRKPAKKAPMGAPKSAENAAPAGTDPLDQFIVAGARALDLTIDPSWMPAVRGHLKVTLAHGARVASFAMPDESEPAPVFEA